MLTFNGGDWEAWYPEDLPEAWRLHYVAGEYRAVMLASSLWMSWDDGFCAEMDWPEHLSVFVEVGENDLSRWRSVRDIWLAQGLKCGGVIAGDSLALKAVAEPAALKEPFDGGWNAFFADRCVTALTGDTSCLKSLRHRVEQSAAWMAEDGILLFDASPAQLESADTLVQLLAR